MTPAQAQLSALVEWVKASSANRPAPLRKDTIVVGAYALLVPRDLSLPPGPAFAAEHLPLWIPDSQAIPGMPSLTQEPPPGPSGASGRLRGLVWKWEDGFFHGALLGLTDPGEPLQSVLERQLPALDLTEHLAVFAPLWLLADEHRTWAEPKLPLVR